MTVSGNALVVVTGANGLVGHRVCELLSQEGARVRAIVRTAGSAPDLPAVEEVVGDFYDPDVAARALAGATGLVTTVHPLGGSAEMQREVAVEGTPKIAVAAREAGAKWLVHVSSAAVYDRSPEVGDVDEEGALVGDDSDAYGVTKRDTDLALAEVEGITRVLVRPPAVLGPGETSVWNTLRPQQIRDDERARHAVADKVFTWVHLDDLARIVAELATGQVATSDDPAEGPVAGGCTALNLSSERATMRDYLGAVADAVGVEPIWDDEPAWTGRLLADRAHQWGWKPQVGLAEALEELRDGLTG